MLFCDNVFFPYHCCNVAVQTACLFGLFLILPLYFHTNVFFVFVLVCYYCLCAHFIIKYRYNSVHFSVHQRCEKCLCSVVFIYRNSYRSSHGVVPMGTRSRPFLIKTQLGYIAEKSEWQ